jgi:hypothetical protein
VQLARIEEADLIVVGTRGLGTLRGAMGSVTYRLIHRAHCPVLVVPGPDPESEQDVAQKPGVAKSEASPRPAEGVK